ncbi:uncharacterized protein LOC121421269 [Lytechinus variegatus]|uniref:uncharacterized protein LOC121421269 n=1 Tax=Lytechinus variegatus TaxID=7654 RepID=UPI001BB24C2E|nr:uncharacterized protein LOC121421269 [Lytechinus variegatus]
MATRSGKTFEETPVPANRESESEFEALVQQLSGWSDHDLTDLVTKRVVPGHWKGTPCFALMEAIRYTIYAKCDQSCTTLFPVVFETLNWKPKSSLCTFLSRLRRMVQKAKSHNIHLLLSEFPGSPHSAHIHPEVGPLCQKSGITKDHLMSPKPSDSGVISVTNAMIIELFKYRERSGTTWETVANKWWPNLFDCHRPLGTIYNSWCQVLKKHRQLRKEERTDFEAKTYTIPPPKPARCTAQADGVQCDGKEDHQDDILDDCSEVDLDCFPDRVSDHTIDSIVNCMQLLANFYEDSGEDHECTKRELAECKKREKMLQSAYDDLIAANDDLKQCLSILKRKNIVRRLHRREEELEEKNETIQNGFEFSLIY